MIDAIGPFLVGLVLGIPLAVYRAFVIAQLWSWFIVPGFHARPISKTLAYGLVWLAALVHQQYVANDEEKSGWYVLVETAGQSLAMSTFGWICGAVARQWL